MKISDVDMRDAFFDELYNIAKDDPHVLFLTADMGAFEELSPHQLVINLIEEAITEKAEAMERINAALQKERQAHEILEQMFKSGDYGDWNRLDILRAKSRIYVAIKYEEYLKKVLRIRTIDELEDSLSRLAAQAYDASD